MSPADNGAAVGAPGAVGGRNARAALGALDAPGLSGDGPGPVPGEIFFAGEPIAYNEGRATTRLTVLNAADRPVQVGSHYHFAEANPGLDFDRSAAHGLRLNIAAGTAVRFEPGIPVDVELVPLAGARFVPGLRGETGGALDSGADGGTRGGVTAGPGGGAGGAVDA